MKQKYIEIAKRLLKIADVEINGSRPWDITVHDPKVYDRVLRDGRLGIGESYMDGQWDCNQLDETTYRLFYANHEGLFNNESFSWSDKLQFLQVRVMNMQSKGRSKVVGEKHYDIGNELYELMLDKRMIYSCGYWRDGAQNIDEAEEAKLDLICRKIGLKEGDTLLDIGCGWGGLLAFAAERYGARGTGISVSKEQISYAKNKNIRLPVEFLFQDYRDPILDSDGNPRKFDHIVSVGMFEHVGPKNYRTFMEVAGKHLKPHGLFLLHTIGAPVSHISNDPWTHKYIFPNSQAPSIAQLARAAENIFAIEDVHNFGTDYWQTTQAWYKNFVKNWDKIKELRDE